MKHLKRVLFVMGMLFSLGLFSACSSDDDETTSTLLYNQWGLVSYVNETGEVQKEAKGYYYQVTFNSDGTYSGLAYGNKMSGRYACVGNRIEIIEGNITQMDVEGADPETVRLRNIDHYTYLRYRKELRVTFMKGLRDSTFTFLGLYSMDHQLSDTNRIVWQRVAEECDLTHLDYLEQLRR